MGDRANVAIIQHPYAPSARSTSDETPPAIWVYLHWGGSELPSNLQAAIKFAQPRWDDEPYGTRILIDQLTKNERDETTSAGVSLEIGDNEYDVLVVDLSERTVGVITQGTAHAGRLRDTLLKLTFDEYLKLDFSEGDFWGVLKGATASPS